MLYLTVLEINYQTAPFRKILPGSWLCDCPLCGKENGVGVVKYNFKGHDDFDVVGVSTCFGGLICKECEGSLSKRGVRNKIPHKDSPEEAKHKREYKKFLEGKLYPEIKCTHIVGRWDAYSDWERRYIKGENKGQVTVCNARLKTDSIYKGDRYGPARDIAVVH